MEGAMEGSEYELRCRECAVYKDSPVLTSKSQRLKVSKNQADVAVEISAGGRDPF